MERKYSGCLRSALLIVPLTSTITIRSVPSQSAETENGFHGLGARQEACSQVLAPAASTAQSLRGTLRFTRRVGADPRWEQRREAVKTIIKRSVEKDHQTAGQILTALKWISPGVGPRVAADEGWCYLYLHLICTREMPRAGGERWEPFPNDTAAPKSKLL